MKKVNLILANWPGYVLMFFFYIILQFVESDVDEELLFFIPYVRF